VLDENELTGKIEQLKGKLTRAQRQIAGLKEKSKYLGMEYEDSRLREKNTNELVMELLERQRELNVMLNRTNIMLGRTQEVMALTSVEFNEMAKALPEPKKAEWSDRVSRINDLFKKTGIADAELAEPAKPENPEAESLDSDEMKHEADKAFSWKDAIWNRKNPRAPAQVEATLVEDESSSVATTAPPEEEITVPQELPEAVVSGNGGESDELDEMDKLLFPPRPKSWWRR
jgi:hypothetical protein